MDLAYCKQCGRRVPDEEIEFGEAHVGENGDVYCNTCAIGLGLEVDVKAAPPKRRRRSRAMAAPARRGSAWPLLVLVAVILVGAGIPTALYILLSRSNGGPPAPPAAPAPAEHPATPGPGTPETPPRETPGPERPEAPPEATRILTPGEVRALARAEFENLRARSGELEKAGRLVEAMDVYIAFPFKYRHTEYHSKAQAERRRLEGECEKVFEGTPERITEMRARLKSADGNGDLLAIGAELGTLMQKIGTPTVATKIEELRKPLGAELARRLAPAMGGDGPGEIPTSFLLWRPGPGASVEWKNKTFIVTFAAAEKGRDITLRLPPRSAWDLSGRTSLVISTYVAAQVTFVVEIATADGGKSSAACKAEGGKNVLDLSSLLLDLRRVTRITIALAEPSGRDIRIDIGGIGVTKR